jgi:hypothetical protein
MSESQRAWDCRSCVPVRCRIDSMSADSTCCRLRLLVSGPRTAADLQKNCRSATIRIELQPGLRRSAVTKLLLGWGEGASGRRFSHRSVAVRSRAPMRTSCSGLQLRLFSMTGVLALTTHRARSVHRSSHVLAEERRRPVWGFLSWCSVRVGSDGHDERLALRAATKLRDPHQPGPYKCWLG